MPVINCRPVEPIVLNFPDKVIKCYINIDSISLLQSEFGDLEKLSEETKNKPYNLAAKLLYCGVKTNDMTFTLEEAERITCCVGARLLDDLANAFIKCCGDVGGDAFVKKYTEGLEKIMQKKG